MTTKKKLDKIFKNWVPSTHALPNMNMVRKALNLLADEIDEIKQKEGEQ